ncbi:hypothetical protein DDB_G0292832 [Dictyostelium discoideum AX4]|uniref:PRELI/MSF1 domain-containing protein n=1 Tax=Dictyostelium discoideum TaxID=44689 RepID=Q54CP2_DICDI|nr:hypothetical protein DDB_G0292832 [Dictyostelium discoideum AX4]EAL60965.1 hypothetical protein DDB_G0292832 [Dictyostelium discoideum AX4]|eukprot:XP_629374.1 hypothetical protein DDB_G0292832 [Dictyostelium discoideum AX4]
MPASHTFPAYTYECPLEFYWEVYNKRFPNHPLFPFIIDSEIVEQITEENGNEKRIRKTKLEVDAPGWFKTLFDIKHSVFIEESYHDKANRKITIKTTNETLSSKAKMIDITVYEVHPENPNWCQFTQTGTVELLVSVLGFQKKIEKYVLDLYKSRYDESRELDKKMIELYREEILKEQEVKKQQQEQTTTTTTTETAISTTTSINIENNANSSSSAVVSTQTATTLTTTINIENKDSNNTAAASSNTLVSSTEETESSRQEEIKV